MTNTLASINYQSPPVVEVAISAQFDRIAQLTQAHLGHFWGGQKAEFPQVRAVPPIETVREQFGEEGEWFLPGLKFEFSDTPDFRLQMTSVNDDWMCQLQQNRLVINWRKRTADYPRFEAAQKRFMQEWHVWQTFLRDSQLAPPIPNHWELTYVNRVPKGELWQTPADWPKIFPGLWGGDFVATDGLTLQGFQGQWIWHCKNPIARLFVEPKLGRSLDTPGQDVMLLTLTARGPVGKILHATAKVEQIEADSGDEALQAGFETGHRLIVTTFDRITSDSAKRHWGKL